MLGLKFIHVSKRGLWCVKGCASWNVLISEPEGLIDVWLWASLRVRVRVNFWQRLTHWGRVMHICISKLTIIGLDNGLSPGRHQAIIWTNAGILLIRTLATNFSEILSQIHKFSFKKIHWKMAAILSRPQCVKGNNRNICVILVNKVQWQW